MIDSISMRRTSFIIILVYPFFPDYLCIAVLEIFFNNKQFVLQSQFVRVCEQKTTIIDTKKPAIKTTNHYKKHKRQDDFHLQHLIIKHSYSERINKMEYLMFMKIHFTVR